MTGIPTIRNSRGERIDCTLHPGDGHPGAGGAVVVIGHGVTGNKDRPFAVGLAEGLEAAGISALRFSFSGNGESEGEFAESTVSKEVEDLGSVLDVLEQSGFAPLCYAGHSMGGAVGVLRAHRDPRIRLLVSLAGMVHVRDFAERKFGDVTPGDGFMWDKEDCPLSQAYMDDMRAIDSVVEPASEIDAPWLLVHGTADTVVPIRDSRDVIAGTGSNTELVELDGVDHVFSDDGLPAMVGPVVSWLRARLADGDER